MNSGKNKKNFQIYTAEEFIVAITQHIPEKSFQMVYEFFDDLPAFNEHADGWPGYDESCVAQN